MANSKTMHRIRTTNCTGPAPLSRESQDRRNALRKRRVVGYVGNPYADLLTKAAQARLYGVPYNPPAR